MLLNFPSRLLLQMEMLHQLCIQKFGLLNESSLCRCSLNGGSSVTFDGLKNTALYSGNFVILGCVISGSTVRSS